MGTAKSSQGILPKQIRKQCASLSGRIIFGTLAPLSPAKIDRTKSTELTRGQVDKLLGLALGGGAKAVSISRQSKGRRHDADRLRKYLARFRLTWTDLAP
jgi:hypothetical protein